MKRWMKTLVIVVLIVTVLIADGLLLYRHFVTNRIMDRGGMVNPDASDSSKTEIQVTDGKSETVEFEKNEEEIS